jgi:NADH-quinone oxidoreductase subunit F
LFTIPADQIVAAIGQSVDADGAFGELPVARNKDGTLKVDPLTGRTSLEWLYAGGDAATGPSSVVEAIAAGERAAVSIDTALTGADHAFWRQHRDVDTAFDPDAEPSALQRAHECLRPVAERRTSFAEVELTWSETTARGEAKRCLRCDYRESCN